MLEADHLTNNVLAATSKIPKVSDVPPLGHSEVKGALMGLGSGVTRNASIDVVFDSLLSNAMLFHDPLAANKT